MGTSVSNPGISTPTPPADFNSSLDEAFADTDSPSESASVESEVPETPAAAEPETSEEFQEEAQATEPGDETEEPEPEVAPPVEEEKPAEEAEEPTFDDEEAIAGTHRGRKGFFLTETKYRSREEAHKTVQEIGRAIADEPTVENIKARNAAYLAEQKMYADFLSADGGFDSNGEPYGQLRFLKNFVDEAARAAETGEAPADAMLSFAEALPYTLGRFHPAAQQALENSTLRLAIDRLYPVAKGQIVAGDERTEALLRALQHIDKAVFKTYKTSDKIQLPDPNQQVPDREHSAAQRLEQVLRERKAESWNRFTSNTNNSIRQDAVEGLIAEALKPFEKTKPEKLGETKELLKSKIEAGFKADAELRNAVQVELNAAQIATSERMREERMKNIVRRHSVAARRIIAAELPRISRELSGQIKAQVDARHQKREAASQHRTPGGTGSPVSRSLIPATNNGQKWSREAFNAELEELFS